MPEQNGDTIKAITYNAANVKTYPWKDIDIIATATDGYYTMGLKSDETMLTDSQTRENYNISDWHDIISIVTGSDWIVGLKSDGTGIAPGLNDKGQCDLSSWHDVIAITAGHPWTVGLKSDGTVVATGENNKEQCEVSTCRDIISIGIGRYRSYTVGISIDEALLTTAIKIEKRSGKSMRN